ncbi:MAG TPA: hypothetical protein DCY48_02100 [Candidatus Magasanikbacteria bacterium]|nr:MAG: hypothetical protein A3I74_01010 [Candidatus Magasanikbacteria bacterium RIFCSPLOWO2_02_FULL_47_16]OGH79976.1 MAG: hypothetical protein A3C10_02215 [Candidatus Magasanikbacteria bacterium RIFCSPHIGHO2_02_FULL_48_18]OGH82988.1 MAG: hypothetical protein A3G08_03700 [Candidatus Magasanikbacteria bacterium RIFCSPLOWO2_12_FULL_47_9b]HAZ28548.1 hypothetical protein [Candidatus Magasanikbacteria bacterium]
MRSIIFFFFSMKKYLYGFIGVLAMVVLTGTGCASSNTATRVETGAEVDGPVSVTYEGEAENIEDEEAKNEEVVATTSEKTPTSSESMEKKEEGIAIKLEEKSGATDDTSNQNGVMLKGDTKVDVEVKAGAEVAINIGAKNFEFSQEEIKVKKGDTVKITLTSTQGFHDWKLDEFKAATKQVNTGETATVEFVADKAGTFEYYCSIGSHRQMGMVGKLIVE